jgi:hypothetical protein
VHGRALLTQHSRDYCDRCWPERLPGRKPRLHQAATGNVPLPSDRGVTVRVPSPTRANALVTDLSLAVEGWPVWVVRDCQQSAVTVLDAVTALRSRDPRSERRHRTAHIGDGQGRIRPRRSGTPAPPPSRAGHRAASVRAREERHFPDASAASTSSVRGRGNRTSRFTRRVRQERHCGIASACRFTLTTTATAVFVAWERRPGPQRLAPERRVRGSSTRERPGPTSTAAHRNRSEDRARRNPYNYGCRRTGAGVIVMMCRREAGRRRGRGGFGK